MCCVQKEDNITHAAVMSTTDEGKQLVEERERGHLACFQGLGLGWVERPD